MEMQMKYFLSGCFSIVRNQPITVVQQPIVSGDLLHERNQLCRQYRIVQITQTANMTFRNDQHVHWRYWRNIRERHGVFTLRDELRSKLAICDTAKDAIFVQA